MGIAGGPNLTVIGAHYLSALDEHSKTVQSA
jgi:hypothetical protein